jgi:hypothetical protein
MDQLAKNARAVGMNSNRLERIRPVLQRYVDEGGYGGFVGRDGCRSKRSAVADAEHHHRGIRKRWRPGDRGRVPFGA